MPPPNWVGGFIIQKYYAPMREIGNHKSIENDVKKRSDTEVQDDKKRYYEGIS